MILLIWGNIDSKRSFTYTGEEITGDKIRIDKTYMGYQVQGKKMYRGKVESKLDFPYRHVHK